MGIEVSNKSCRSKKVTMESTAPVKSGGIRISIDVRGKPTEPTATNKHSAAGPLLIASGTREQVSWQMMS
jgi:hypothetical protein